MTVYDTIAIAINPSLEYMNTVRQCIAHLDVETALPAIYNDHVGVQDPATGFAAFCGLCLSDYRAEVRQ